MSVALQLLLAHIGRATSTEPDAAGVAQVRDLCHQCQAANPSDRPTFKQICQQLSKVETNTLASQMVKLMEEKKILHDILPEHVRPPLRIATPLPMCEEQTRGACGGRSLVGHPASAPMRETPPARAACAGLRRLWCSVSVETLAESVALRALALGCCPRRGGVPGVRDGAVSFSQACSLTKSAKSRAARLVNR